MEPWQSSSQSSPPPNDPSPLEEREQMARAGDVRGLFELITRSPAGTFNLSSAFDQLRRALAVAGTGDPAKFADRLYEYMGCFCGYVMLRAQFHCLRTLENCDWQTRQMPSELTNHLLPQLHSIQTQLVEIQQARASTARLWQLARKSRQEKEPTSLVETPAKSNGKLAFPKGKPDSKIGKKRLPNFLDDLPN
jgi:hypothetical protein